MMGARATCIRRSPAGLEKPGTGGSRRLPGQRQRGDEVVQQSGDDLVVVQGGVPVAAEVVQVRAVVVPDTNQPSTKTSKTSSSQPNHRVWTNPGAVQRPRRSVFSRLLTEALTLLTETASRRARALALQSPRSS